MTQIKMASHDIPDIGQGRGLQPRMCHRNRHGKINPRIGGQRAASAFRGERLVKPGKPVDDLIFLRSRVEWDRMVVPEGLRSAGEMAPGRTKVGRDLGGIGVERRADQRIGGEQQFLRRGAKRFFGRFDAVQPPPPTEGLAHLSRVITRSRGGGAEDIPRTAPSIGLDVKVGKAARKEGEHITRRGIDASLGPAVRDARHQRPGRNMVGMLATSLKQNGTTKSGARVGSGVKPKRRPVVGSQQPVIQRGKPGYHAVIRHKAGPHGLLSRAWRSCFPLGKPAFGNTPLKRRTRKRRPFETWHISRINWKNGIRKRFRLTPKTLSGNVFLMGEPARLKVIAARLNLSQSTVSRALNDYRDISDRTKQLVREAAEELGYQPNIHARRLALGKSETLGYVMPWQDDQLTESFLSELMAGMAKALSGYGWDLTVLVPHSVEEEIELFQKIARTRHISGLVISRTYSDDQRFRMLRDLQIPFVSHGRSSDCDMTAWLDVDNELAFAEMAAHLAALGHRRIAHIAGPEVYNFARQRRTGWRSGIDQAGLDPTESPLEVTELSFEGGKAAMGRLLALECPPTAVCCVSDVVAIGAMLAIREAGLVPGREISLIGYDGLEIGAWIEPPLTTMRQPQQSAGRRLAEMLIRLVEGTSQPSDTQELVRASLVRRGTANPPVSGWPAGRQAVRQQT